MLNRCLILRHLFADGAKRPRQQKHRFQTSSDRWYRGELSLHSPHVTSTLASSPRQEVENSCSILMPRMRAGPQPNQRLRFY